MYSEVDEEVCNGWEVSKYSSALLLRGVQSGEVGEVEVRQIGRIGNLRVNVEIQLV